MFWSDAHSQQCWKSCSQKLPFDTSLDLPIAFNLAVSDDTRSHYLEWKRFVFSLLHINLLDSHQRFPVKAEINKLVTGSFLHFRISKALQNSRWKLLYLWPIPEISMPDMSSHLLRDALLLQFLWSCHQLPLWPEENPSCIEGVEEHVYAEVLMNVIFEERVVRREKKRNLKGNSGIGYL